MKNDSLLSGMNSCCGVEHGCSGCFSDKFLMISSLPESEDSELKDSDNEQVGCSLEQVGCSFEHDCCGLYMVLMLSLISLVSVSDPELPEDDELSEDEESDSLEPFFLLNFVEVCLLCFAKYPFCPSKV